MQPLNHDIRSYYRKHAVSSDVTDTGVVSTEYKVDGPYSLAFRAGGASRSRGEQGFTYEGTQYLVIADGVHVFHAGDILTTDRQGEHERYAVTVVKDWPSEQTMYVRALYDD